MEYASFWGLTAPQLILLDLEETLFRDLVKMLNNSQDSHRLKDLLIEFRLLEKFMDETVIYEYENGDIRRKARQVKLSKEHYTTGKKVPSNMLLSKEELSITEQIISTAKKQVAPYIMQNGLRVDLSEPAVSIIEYTKKHMRLIQPYIKSIQVNSVKEVKVFGRSLEDTVYGKAAGLKYRYCDKLKDFKSSNGKRADTLLPTITEAMKNDINILLKAIENTDEVSETKQRHDVRVSDSGLVEDRNNIINREHYAFLVTLNQIGLLKNINLSQLTSLDELYGMVITLKSDYFNLAFNLALDSEEYKKVFRELDDIGLVGYNAYADSFLENSLNGIALVEDLKAVIDRDSELARVIIEMDRGILVANKKYGEVI